MPVRKIPPNARSITGRLASHDGGSWQHESQLEREVLILVSCDPDVASIETQPVRIYYDGEDSRGRKRVLPYTPDTLVHFHACSARPPLLIEVKPLGTLRKDLEKLRPKLQAGLRYARERGWQFKVYTERRIPRTFLENAKFLRPYLRERFSADDARPLLTTLCRLGRSTVGDLLAACSGDPRERSELLAVLWWLLAKREVGVDLRTERLSSASAVWPLPARARVPARRPGLQTRQP